jgi:hypothetical protein
MSITDYEQRVARLDLGDIDWDDFRRRPLDPASLRCLRYMHDVEYHTVCYLRDLLTTRAHSDPEVTAFLTFWNYEEYWHGQALSQVLEAHEIPAGPPRVGRRRDERRRRDSLAPLVHGLSSFVARDSLIAVHLTWGAINEWTTQAGYARLAELAHHPTLRELLRRIMRQEGRHIDFYASQAARRLDDDHRARRLTRWALRRLWRPVGAGVQPAGEVRFLVTHLFGDDDGRATVRRIDRRVDALPGLTGLHLTEGALDLCLAA